MGVTEANPGYEKEPGWDILKNQLTLKLANANSGRGLGLTTYSGGSPYSSFTWIGMGELLFQLLATNIYYNCVSDQLCV